VVANTNVMWQDIQIPKLKHTKDQ